MHLKHVKGKIMRLYAGVRMLLGVAALALGCNRSVGASTKDSPTAFDDNGKSYNLAIVGYNYTSRYIATFSVNGSGGGKIEVSSPTTGGSGSSCCASYSPDQRMVTVEWQADACLYNVRSSITKEDSDEIHSFYKEVRVPVTANFTSTPNYLEVHIYPDEKVEVVVTDRRSSPRLKLSESRADRGKFRRCPDNKEPL